MCGIVAIYSPTMPVSSDAMLRAVASLRHRGPDDADIWLSDGGRAGLGHTRLSIIDLWTGRQPIANEDGNLRAVVNGEFYDFERIRCELVNRGHRFSTQSDSEIALHLFEERGVSCLDDLRGEFAFAIWNEQQNTLFAARDRFGIKPLYYVQHNGAVMLASEIKALAAAGFPLHWDRAAVAQALFSNLGPRQTLFRGVHQVPPGHYLVASQSSVRISSYWNLDYPRANEPRHGRSDTEWIEGLRGQVEEAVRLRLRADVPIGCLLSGGLDSSAAMGMARTFFRGPMKAFTIAFESSAFDESATAAASAARMNVEFQRIPVTNSDFSAVFADAVWHGEGVHYNAHGAARYLLSRAVQAAGIKVVLAGEGADELTAGYRFFDCAFGLAGPLPPTNWPTNVLEGLSRKEPSADTIAAVAVGLTTMSHALTFPASMVANVAGGRAVKLGLIDAGFLAEFTKGEPNFSFFRQFDVAGQLDGREPVRQLMHLWMKSGFVNYVLAGERLDMAHGVEQRLPFLDHKLFEFMREVPLELMRRPGSDKWVLREALRPYVTHEVYQRKKQPFFAPPSILDEGSPMLTYAQDTLRAAGEVPFFDHSVIAKFLDQLPRLASAERAQLDPTVFFLLSLAVLHERYAL